MAAAEAEQERDRLLQRTKLILECHWYRTQIRLHKNSNNVSLELMFVRLGYRLANFVLLLFFSGPFTMLPFRDLY